MVPQAQSGPPSHSLWPHDWARPEARIVTVLGDGTAGFHIMEYDTAFRYNIPFVAVLGNDAAWNAEYQIQLREYGDERLVGCELLPSRYDLVVEALGGHGENVESANDLAPALERAGALGLPALVNVNLGPRRGSRRAQGNRYTACQFCDAALVGEFIRPPVRPTPTPLGMEIAGPRSCESGSLARGYSDGRAPPAAAISSPALR